MAKNCGNCYNFIFEKRYSHLICGGFCSEKHSEIRCACSPDTQCEKWVYSGAKTCRRQECAFFLLGCPLEPDDKFNVPNGNKKDDYYNGKSCLNHIENFFAFHEFLSPYENFYIGNIIKYLWRYKKKNGVKDLEKAKQYLDYLINEQKRGRK